MSQNLSVSALSFSQNKEKSLSDSHTGGLRFGNSGG